MTTPSEAQQEGTRLRTEALALLEQAEKLDGLRAYEIHHEHSHGLSHYLMWSAEYPSDQQAEAVLDIEFDPDADETLEVFPGPMLRTLCGL